MIHYIYTLTDPRTKMIRYVGKTNKPSVRLAMHMCEKRGTHKNNWLHQLRSLGLKPVMEIIEQLDCENDEWAIRERFWISHFRALGIPLTNLDSGGSSGKLLSEETKAKIRAKAIGRKLSPESIAKMKAAKAAGWSEERRENMRNAQLGKKQSVETKAKRSAAMMGHECSPQTREKLRVKHAGRLISEEVKAKIRIARAQQIVVNNQYTKGRNLQ